MVASYGHGVASGVVACASVRTVSLALLLVLASASSALAQATACTELADREVRARLAVLSGVVDREEPAVRRWFTSFALLHGVMASAAGILAASADDEGFRNEMLVGTLSSSLALLSLVVVGPPLLGAGTGLRALPEDTAAERLHKLRVAEDALRRDAAAIDFLRSWFPATASTLYVAAAAGTLLLALERPSGAITHSVGGAVLGLGRILLRPIGSRSAWRSYLRAHPDADCTEVPAVAERPDVAVVVQGLGLGLRVDF